ncbi:MAG: RNA-binding domain-containing protein [Chitinispirillaceae bacterium]
MSVPNLRQLAKQGEGQHLELKKTAQNPRSIAAVVTSFLNSGGGTVLIGVDEKGTLVGINNAEDEAMRIHSFLNKMITPKPLLSVSVDTDNNQAVITVEVPAAKDIPFVVEGTVYIRSKSITQPVDGETLRRMIREQANETERWERRISPDLRIEDVINIEIEETVKTAAKTGRFAFANPDSSIDVLKELGLTKGSQLTNAADVLFGRDCSNRHPQTRVRATRFMHDKGSDYIDDQVYQGPLCLVLRRVEDFILRNIPVESRFLEAEMQRKDTLAYPRYAIREGLVNAFAHRDYAAFTGGISVGVYPTRIEIWNSGHLPKEIKLSELKKRHPSLPNNPDVAHVLYIREFMERIGRGTQKIVEACKKHGLPAPNWKDDSSGVTLTLHSKKKGVDSHYNSRQQALLDNLSPGDSIRPGEYRKRFAGDVSERQARRDLTELENVGIMEKVGAGAASAYRRTNRP